MCRLDCVDSARFVPVALIAAALVTGCASTHPTLTSPVQTITQSPTPRPTVTVLRSGIVVAAGHSATVHAQQGVTLTIRASRPSISRTRLSSSYGYPPANGYYVTFQMTIVNTGSDPVAIGPSSFRVRVRGQGVVTVTSGNAPYSGASSQLDSTEIDPGESLSGPLTFDVRRVHGTLEYAPDKSAAITWVF